MDRNTLLKSSRVHFLSTFNDLIGAVVHQSIEGLYLKADKSLNSQMQSRLLDARTFVAAHEAVLVGQIVSNMQTLLERSFQTAYNAFRPSFFKAAKSAKMELMDINVLENDLKIDVLTGRFRSEAGEQLRDLNIRIAILFERNDIAERENPFRPYLLIRAITLGVESTLKEADLVTIVTDQIAAELLIKVQKLYEGVNNLLSKHGVAAQLQFRSPKALVNESDSDDDEENSESGKDNKAESRKTSKKLAAMHARQAFMPNSSYPPSQRQSTLAAAPINRVGKIEQLINYVKHGYGHGQTSSQSGRIGPLSDGASSLSSGDGFIEGGGMSGGVGGGMSGGVGGGMSSDIQQGMGGFLNQASATLGGWLEGAQEVGQTLRRVFYGGGQSGHAGESGLSRSVGQVDDAGEMAESGGTGGGGTAQTTISSQLNHALHSPMPATGEMFGHNGEVRNLIIERRESLSSMTSDQNEKMTIDIVAMLFEFILKDHQVPAEVRAQLGRLQFSVLKMALMDSALLTKKSHPVRMLVNRIGSISIGLQQVDPSGERISAEICLIVEALLADDLENSELFTKMLDQFDTFIAQELLLSNKHVEDAVSVVVNAEQRSTQLNVTGTELKRLMEELTVHPYLSQFLLTTWPYVIERAEHKSKENIVRFRLLVPNLLWSILPKPGHEERCTLLQIIPDLVQVLREGMGLVSWEQEQQQELLNWLVDAHTAVMRSGPANGSVTTLADLQQHFHHFVYADETASTDLSVGLIDANNLNESNESNESNNAIDSNERKINELHVPREFLDEAVKELEADLNTVGIVDVLDNHEELLEEDERDLSDEDRNIAGLGVQLEYNLENKLIEKEGGNDVDIFDRLRSGVIVELNLSGNPTRGRLNWISPNSGNLILTVDGQNTPSVISVRMFRRMLKNTRARFVEVAPLFERAVQSLLESADRIDLAQL